MHAAFRKGALTSPQNTYTQLIFKDISKEPSDKDDGGASWTRVDITRSALTLM